MRIGDIAEALGAFLAIIFTIAATFMWATHIVWAIRCLSSDSGANPGQVALGFLGSIVPPVGVIHGGVILFVPGF